jgi:hypothetical protein
VQPQVVQRELERLLGGAHEAGDRPGDVLGALAAVAEGPQLDQGCCARRAALCARLAAW